MKQRTQRINYKQSDFEQKIKLLQKQLYKKCKYELLYTDLPKIVLNLLIKI